MKLGKREAVQIWPYIGLVQPILLIRFPTNGAQLYLLHPLSSPERYDFLSQYLEAMAEENRTGTTSYSPEKKDVNSPNLIERAKEEAEAVFHSEKSPRHDKETHGTSDDIDESTPVDEVKGPSIFHRMKEEIEAVVESVLPKNQSNFRVDKVMVEKERQAKCQRNKKDGQSSNATARVTLFSSRGGGGRGGSFHALGRVDGKGSSSDSLLNVAVSHHITEMLRRTIPDYHCYCSPPCNQLTHIPPSTMALFVYQDDLTS